MGARRRASAPGVELRLLGPLEVTRGERSVSLGAAKPRQLLVALALEVGRAVAVDALVEALWPTDTPASAEHAIQVYVSQLRKGLGSEVVGRRNHAYVLELEPERLDLHRFARLLGEGRDALAGGDAARAASVLRDGLALWRGPALADFTYEPFAQGEIARLEELRLEAIEARIEADLALGRHHDVVPELEALVRAEPLREHPRAQLMLALYRSGRQAEALAAYRSGRERLVDELGVEPGPELRALEAAILRQEHSLLPEVRSRELRTRRPAAVVSFGLEVDAPDIEVEEQRVSDAQDVVASVVARHGGVAERLADGSVTAVFGVPVTHEDDPLRAARAAIQARALANAVPGVVLSAAIEIGEVIAGERGTTGHPVRAAATLRHQAISGDVLLGAEAARRLDHVAILDPRGDAAVLVELVDQPRVARAPDVALVGRRDELSQLRSALSRARGRARPGQAVLVLGPAGVGKSRLAGELTRRARGVTALWGRCLPYGDGITYWPLREMLGQAGPSDEALAVAQALDADPPLGVSQVALLFRRLCETRAAEQPLVLVFDDLHWAEPTMLELVAHLIARAEGRILVVCVARDELLEDHPWFATEHPALERLVLEELSREETEALVDLLSGSVLDEAQRARIADVSDGNPLFVEQLLGHALQGGFADDPPPSTIESLLAARLDRLGPGERAVLERGAVVGTEFTSDDVAALLEQEVRDTGDAHLASLVERAFLRGLGGTYAFRHVLVRDAVYRSAPKRLRAELHERFAARLDESYATLPDLDEFVGYHLEQASRLRAELGEADGRTETLAGTAGRRLGAAGFRALRRGDMTATVSLLERATGLLPRDDEERHSLMCELGIAQHAAGDAERALTTFTDAIADAEWAGNGRVALRARIEAAYSRLLTAPEGAAQELVSAAEEAVPTFEALGDDRGLARAWLLLGYVRGGVHGNHAAWEEAEERALVYYRRTNFPTATCLGQIAAATYWGPTPVSSGIDRCSELAADPTVGLVGRAAVIPYLGGLYAQVGRFAEARELVGEAESIYDELGAATSAIHCGTVKADVELLADDLEAAERTLREQCAYLERRGDHVNLAIRSAKLAETLYRLGRFDEADEWAVVSRAAVASDDLSAQLILRSVEAKLLARRGALPAARELAEQAARLAEATDGLNQIAATKLALGEVLRIAGHSDEADRVIEEAAEVYERKGNTVGASLARALLATRGPA